VVDQSNRKVSGRQADALVDVAVDDVVDPPLALDLAGLAATQVMAGFLLHLQGDVLGHVPHPGALAQALHEATGDTAGAGMPRQPGKEGEELVGEACDGVGGVVLEAA